MEQKVFVEIGACDFDNLDALLDEGWIGYFVEPIPVYYNSLIEKIKKSGRVCHFTNVAISNYTGTVEMTYIDPKTTDQQWVRGISHMTSRVHQSSRLIPRNVNEGHDIGKPVTIEVPCWSLDVYLERQGLTNIDMLRMDVEGHELQILCEYSWTVMPKRIKIEHKFVHTDRLRLLLESKGYVVMEAGDDFYCIMKE